jgi:hypothetical protein
LSNGRPPGDGVRILRAKKIGTRWVPIFFGCATCRMH